MPSIKLKEGQSLLDIAIQQFGSTESVVDIALHNNVSITEPLTAGTVIKIPHSVFKNIEISDYYKKKSLEPATALLSPDMADIAVAGDMPEDNGGNTFSREYTIEYTQELGSII
ncbi:MAG: hypothetical protein U0T77_10780 [Chitinophagales bacterium]